MRRREFITVLATALAWPLAARARAPNGMARIGFLGLERRLEKFRQGLRDLGYVEGRNIVIEYRPSDPADRLPGFAAELVALNADVIVAGGSLAVRAAQQVTRTIPIVMTGTSDPVGTGFVASLARPGGNITGLSLLSPELSGKRLALLKEIVKDLSRLAILLNPDDPAVMFSLRETEKAARASGMEINLVEARSGKRSRRRIRVDRQNTARGTRHIAGIVDDQICLADCRACSELQDADNLLFQRVSGGWRPDVLWTELRLLGPARCRLCRSDTQGR